MSTMQAIAILTSVIGVIGLAACIRFPSRGRPAYEMLWAASMALLWLGIFQYSHIDQVSFPLLLVSGCLSLILYRAWSMLRLNSEP